MIDPEVMDILEKFAVAYRTLLEQTDFLTTELLKHRLTEFDKKTISLGKLHIKVRAVEEGLEGVEKYVSSTLKELKAKKSKDVYSIK